MPIKSVARSSGLPRQKTSRLKNFRITGYAMVPVECAMVVMASDEQAALRAAQKKFDEAGVCFPNCRKNFIVPGSANETGVHSFKPKRAVRL